MSASSRPAQPSPDLTDDDLDAIVSSASAGVRYSAQASSLSAYIQRVENLPQLPAEKQAELSLRYQQAAQLKARMDRGELRGRAVTKARAEWSRAQRDLELLVGSNFRLVVTIAKELVIKRYGPQRHAEVLPDMVAEGNLGLTQAVQTYDPERCPLFPIYAARMVRDRVRAALTKSAPVRIPPSWARLQNIARARKSKMETALRRPPTTEELQADLLEVCLEWAESKLTAQQRTLSAAEQRKLMLARLKKQGMLGAIQRLDEVLAAPNQTGLDSLDAPLSSSEGTMSKVDMLKDSAGDAAFEGVERGELQEALQRALAELSERERFIVLARYGFLDGERWPYAKLAERYDVSAERIRQIDRAVLNKLASSEDDRFSFLTAFRPAA